MHQKVAQRNNFAFVFFFTLCNIVMNIQDFSSYCERSAISHLEALNTAKKPA